MTLVVSDISKHGIVMVGDSAVTRKCGATIIGVDAGAVKAQYCAIANVGITMWGYGQVDNTPLDLWVSNFLSKRVDVSDNIETIGIRLANDINQYHLASGKSWQELVCGFHLGGYINGKPHLYHVHCGHQNEPSHELRLYRDYPIDQNWTEQEFQHYLDNGFIHIRNGYHPLFGTLFDNIMKYSEQLKTFFDITFPQDNLEGRLSFYKELVKFVAGVLVSSGMHEGVNSTLSSIAFNQKGIAINQELPFSPVKIPSTGILDYYINEK